MNNTEQNILKEKFKDIMNIEESPAEFLIRLGVDGDLWAKEFLKIFPKLVPDLDTTRGWFCNAIMAGYDKAIQLAQKENQRGKR